MVVSKFVMIGFSVIVYRIGGFLSVFKLDKGDIFFIDWRILVLCGWLLCYYCCKGLYLVVMLELGV